MVVINIEKPNDCKKCPLLGTDGDPRDYFSPMMCIAIYATTHEIKRCIGGKVRGDCPLVEIGICKDCIHLSEVYRVIAGHSDYHGDNILAALTCIAEGKEVDTIKPLSPTHKMCKDCARSKILNDNFEGYSLVCSRFGRMAVNPDFYCADFEKRGKNNG